MQTYFNIRYELDKESVHHCIARQINKGAIISALPTE